MLIVLSALVLFALAFFLFQKKHFMTFSLQHQKISESSKPSLLPSVIVKQDVPITLKIFSKPAEKSWSIQSIDTMKYSRDLAREKSKDKNFLKFIDAQVKNIAKTGANFVSIDTPYDQEFFPMLSKWVAAARKYDLHVWFRGNLSGWEGWFGYSKINREQHIKKTTEFILNHPDIFEDGDIFSACPECENGAPGDPRQTGDVDGFRNFIISEYASTQKAFDTISKRVSSNYYPMNADIANLIMDKKTTQAMNGIIVVDHYVSSPENLVADLKDIRTRTGSKVILGEFGAPLPEINGKMTETQQAQWINDVLARLSVVDGIGGVNYWLNAGGSTGIWNIDGKPSAAVDVLKKYFISKNAFGVVTDKLNNPISGAHISFPGGSTLSTEDGYFEIMHVENFPIKITVSAEGFSEENIEITDNNQTHIILNEK